MRTKFITILLGCLTFALLVALLLLTMTAEPAYAQPSSLASNICLSPIEGPIVRQPMIGVDLPDLGREIWWAVNRERLTLRLRPLGLTHDLVSVAIERSKDMIERGYFSHQMPGGKMVWDLLDERGISGPQSYVGEIIARAKVSDPMQIVKAWMDSPAHNHVLTCSLCTHVGIGLATDLDGRNYITMVFMGGGRRMTVPAMLDLIVEQKDQIRQEVFREMDLTEMLEAAKRFHVSLRVWFQQEVERRMCERHPFYGYQLPRIGHSRYRK